MSSSVQENLAAATVQAIACIERLESQVAQLEGEVAARDYTINDMCDEIWGLKRKTEVAV